jgi:hypothetical protein
MLIGQTRSNSRSSQLQTGLPQDWPAAGSAWPHTRHDAAAGGSVCSLAQVKQMAGLPPSA